MASARDRLNRWRSPLHAWVLRRTGGRLGGRVGKAPVLVLTTTGRRTGQTRRRALMYVPDGDGWIVAASNAGQDHAPAWFGNLQASPSATVEVGGRTVAVQAEVVEDPATWWPRFDAMFGPFADYRRKTARAIPLVRLRPGGTGDGSSTDP